MYSKEDDAKRLKKILSILPKEYHRALDIGCGEGYITRHLPASIISGIDLCDSVKLNLPSNVIPLKAPIGEYDLVICTNTLYEGNNPDSIYLTIMDCSYEHILIGGAKDKLIDYNFGKTLKSIEFTCGQETQKITLYERI